MVTEFEIENKVNEGEQIILWFMVMVIVFNNNLYKIFQNI